MVKFAKTILFFANSDFILGISTNKSLPRWGKVAQRLAKFIVLLYFGVVTDEVVTQSVILFSICFVMTVLPRGDAIRPPRGRGSISLPPSRQQSTDNAVYTCIAEPPPSSDGGLSLC